MSEEHARKILREIIEEKIKIHKERIVRKDKRGA